MDITELLKDVKTSNEYISATRNVLTKRINSRVNINQTTVQTLKKIRSLEIEYFNRCEENGAACILFERMLTLPPSITWGVLAKELISTLQYWLDGIRKHLIAHNAHWWMFLKQILKFIKDIRLKDPSIPNLLVEFTAECLLDLATASQPDLYQRHEILHCLNIVCADSGREIRFAMKTKFGDYFVKLAERMTTAGHFPCQYAILECLIRWLVPRQEMLSQAANRWLPHTLCPPRAKILFLTSKWQDFQQDSRCVLNALNEVNGLVTSVVCRQLTVGDSVYINGSEKHQTWLDFNTADKSMSMMLDTKVLKLLGTNYVASEILLINGAITDTAKLYREPIGLIISISTVRPPYIRPSEASWPDGDVRDVTIVVSSRVHLPTLDLLLKDTFGDKYLLLLDLDTDVSQSPQISHNTSKSYIISDEDTRFSHPAEVKRRNQSGSSRLKNAYGSPSSVSTSSLVQLPDKLAALPRYPFDKQPKTVCLKQELSTVTELDERSTASGSTLKFSKHGSRHWGPKSRSEGESNEPKTNKKSFRSDSETTRKRRLNTLSLLNDAENDGLLVATVDSYESVIKETVERLSQPDCQRGYIADLLVQEALNAEYQAAPRNNVVNTKPSNLEVSDSGINTDEKKSQEESEAIDNTPRELKSKKKIFVKKNCTIVSKSTTEDESNTEAVVETTFVTPKEHRFSPNVNENKQILDAKTIEDFFSQHASVNPAVISPSLAKKINASSSESSEDFFDKILIANYNNVNTDIGENIFNEKAVTECLTDMVDRVCSDFDKCTEYLYNDKITTQVNKLEPVDGVDTDNFRKKKNPKLKTMVLPKPKSKTVSKTKKNIETKPKPATTRAKTGALKKEVNQEDIKKMSIIKEQTEEEIVSEHPEANNEYVATDIPRPINESPLKDLDNSVMRRKRKLYSPKDDTIQVEKDYIAIEQENSDVPLSMIKASSNIKAPKTIASCYKEIEKERNKFFRNRRSKGNITKIPSPRTIKNDTLFDNLKQTVESNENITVVDKCLDVFNFTSDSEDENFVKKKIETKTRTNKIGGVEKRNRGRRLKYTDSSTEHAKKPVIVRRKYIKRTNKRKADINIDPVIDLVNERMRDGTREQLNTSIVLENPVNHEPILVEPVSHRPHQMESIPDEPNDTVASKKNVTKKAKNAELLSIKKEKGLSKKDKDREVKDKLAAISNQDNDGTISPLPGLVVESMPDTKDDLNESEAANMLQKFKNIYHNTVINDSVNTQNMRSDVDRSNYNIQNDLNDSCFAVDVNKVDVQPITKKDKCKKVVKESKTAKTIRKVKKESKDIKESIAFAETFLISDNESEKSIATDGITAHIDSDEAPPATEAIAEHIQPREIQDMDESMKEYFVKLTRVINDYGSKNSSADEKAQSPTMKRNDVKKSAVSPVVSVKRLSFDDISKWMPSRRTSDSSSHSNLVGIQTEKVSETTPKSKNQAYQKSSTPDSAKSKSPIVPIKRISLEEFNKWFPMPKINCEDETLPQTQSSAGIKLVYNLKSKSNVTKSQNFKAQDKSDTKKPIKMVGNSKRVKTDSDNDSDEPKNTKRVCRKMPVRKLVEQSDIERSGFELRKLNYDLDRNLDKDIFGKDVEKANDNDKTHMKEKKKADLYDSSSTQIIRTVNPRISPIRLDDFKTKITVTKSDDDDDDDECERRILSKSKEADKSSSQSVNRSTSIASAAKDSHLRPTKSTVRTRSQSRSKKSPVRTRLHLRSKKSPVRTSAQSRSKKSPVRTRLHSRSRKSPERPKSPSPVRQSPVRSRSPVRPLEPVRLFKRQSSSPILSVPKKKIYDPNKRVEVLESVTIDSNSSIGRTISSVNDWFTRGPKVNDEFTQLSEMVKSVLEKLDTTLAEVNHNTGKKLVEHFVETQKQLSSQNEEIREMYSNNVDRLVEFFMETQKQFDRQREEIREMFLSNMERLVEFFVETQKQHNTQKEEFQKMCLKNMERMDAMNLEFMEQQKKAAVDIMRDNRKQNHAMVVILKEDCQAVLDHINRDRRKNPA